MFAHDHGLVSAESVVGAATVRKGAEKRNQAVVMKVLRMAEYTWLEYLYIDVCSEETLLDFVWLGP